MLQFSADDLFVSHGRLYKDNCIVYAYNNKEVTLLDLESKEKEVLYRHAHCIVAF